MQHLKFSNVFGAVSILFLAGGVGYVIGVNSTPAGTQEDTILVPTSTTETSASIDITDVLGGILNWNVNQAVEKTLMCDDGTRTAVGANIVHLGVGPINETENTVEQAVVDIRKALSSDRWTRCRSANVGGNVEETYRKNSQLFQIEARYSAGTGNTLDLYFEYSR